MKLAPPVENLGVHDFWTGPMDHVQCLWVSPGSLFTLQSPSRWLNLNTRVQPATKPQYLDTSVHVRHCSVQCTWLNRHRLSLVETIYSLLCPSQDSIGNCVQLCVTRCVSTTACTIVCDSLCVHDSSSSTGGVRSRSVDWIAPCGARNTSRQKIRFLKGRLTPIDGDDDEGRWSYCISKAAHIPGGGNYNPSVAQRVHWCVCTWGREPGFISQYASKQKHKRFTFVPLHCQTVKNWEKVWLKQQSRKYKLKIVQGPAYCKLQCIAMQNKYEKSRK